MQKRNARQSVCAEITAEAKMDSRQQAVPDISAHILASGRNYGSMFRKQPDKRLCKKLHDNDGGNAPKDGGKSGVAQGQAGAFMLACPDILGTERRYGRKHGRRDQE